ncbi:MAG: flippase [Myxococcaceae bacterium]
MSAPEPTSTNTEAHGQAHAGHQDMLTAIRNAMLLGGSLLATYGVSLGIRILLPRFMGPDLIGRYNFADSFAAQFLILVSLGVDTYVHREIPVAPRHADDFYGGITLVRFIGFFVLLLVMAGILIGTHRTPEVQLLVFGFAIFHFLFTINGTLAALLHATTNVGGLSALNVWTKVLWAGGTLVAVYFGGNLVYVVAAQVISEAVKTVGHWRLVQRELRVKWRVDWVAVTTVIKSSLPMYLNGLALAVYGRLGVTILDALSTDAEVGYFGQAYGLAMLTLMGTPLIFWVLLPLFSRAARRSDEELNGHVRRSLELILAFAFPASLFMGLGAELWIQVFGKAFLPSVGSLQLLSPVFILTYVAVLAAAVLQQLRHAWTVTLVSLSSIVASPLLNLVLIPAFTRFTDNAPGGPATGAAAALLSTETVIAGLMLFFIGRRAFDARNIAVIVKSVLICGAVIIADHYLKPIGHWRLFVTVPLYVVLALVTRTVRPMEAVALAKNALATKRAAAQEGA